MLMLHSGQWASVGLLQRQAFLQQAVTETGTPSEAGTAMESQELIALIHACLNSFWDADSEPLMKKLESAAFQKGPEWKAMAERLQAWYPMRDQLRELAGKMGRKSLGAMMCDMVTMSARGIAEWKNQVTYQRRGWFAGSFRSQAKLIKDQYPRVYALDPAWFEQWIGPST
jgi:hypothetical protein